MPAGKVIVAAVFVLALVIGGAVIYSYIPKVPDKTIGTHPIKFSAMDRLAGGQDATTSAVDIYRMVGGEPVFQETVTINAAEVSTILSYTSMEALKCKLYDASDTSICTQFEDLLVPYDNPSNVYNNYFMVDLQFTDRGDTNIAVLAAYDTTNIAANTILDLTTRGWNSVFADWQLTLRQTVADKGYVNSYDFLYKHLNDQYLVFDVSDVSGATAGGWTKFIISGGGGMQICERNNHRYLAIHVADESLTRDLQSTGVYNPNGRYDLDLTMNLKGLTTGMNISIVQSYLYYGDWQNFVSTGTWGENMAQTTLTYYLQY
jgi:hypothetical protein